MNAYSFYHKGENYTTIWGNEETENYISACADLTRRGFTPEYWHNPDTGKNILVYSDSFKLEKMFRHSNGNWTSRVITPENISILAKSLQRKLSAFTYDGEEWRVKTK